MILFEIGIVIAVQLLAIHLKIQTAAILRENTLIQKQVLAELQKES